MMKQNQHPNVIYILADDMGYGDFGIFSDGSARTPNLDRLVRQGCAMSHCYAASPVCAPARAALLTGRYPHRTGAVDTYEAIGGDRMALREVTLADVYRANGYRTGLIGKWHLGLIGKEYHPAAGALTPSSGSAAAGVIITNTNWIATEFWKPLTAPI
ncbi:sulfatase-like hydrolase/transferase [Eisenbergiella tayi]|uniref:sulfatase-like hydrolase/transferase n=1 Tax=Eisenbergiella tayi TaxID=1432052 RepID=UPI0004B989B1|nr:sulfatase-like hydrolase/transferase [Eisenbergiella tayi]